MRIGVDARMYSTKFTGIGRYTSELIHHLLEIDPNNEYKIFLKKEEYDTFSSDKPNVEKICADYPHYSFKEQLFFPRLINKYKLDLMHFTHFNAPLLYRKKCVVTIHDLTLSFFPGKKMTDPIHRLAYYITLKSIVKKAKKTIAVSKNTKKDLINQFSFDENNIEVIYEGISSNFYVMKDQKKLNEVKEKYHLKKPFLLYTGVWRSHKNLKGLVKAFKILKDSYHLDCDLIITGKENSLYAKEIKAIIKELGLEDTIKFLGLVDEKDLGALYNLASIYVFPSFYEGFGLPPLEAMSTGTPVASSNTSSLPEVCGESAVYFDPYNSEDIASKVAMLYRDKNMQKSLIESGFKNLKRFSWKTMAKKTLQIYESL